MHTRTVCSLLISLAIILSSRSSSELLDVPHTIIDRITTAQFKALMESVADGWNTSNARRAADCFTDDALYSSPPNPIRRGRETLFEFFGGAKGRRHPMKMQWHHLLFDEESQIGAGEYTFTYDIRTHGAVMVRLVNGKIANWREYETESPMEWEQFVGANRF
jgi:ketosteroid isomerase-like protein